jgi:hypothetical protein
MVDFAFVDQEAVKAVGDGTAAFASDSCIGNFVEITHTIGTNTYKSRYLHLHAVGVTQGQQVQQGKLIGWADNTGSCTTGTHLHFDTLNSAGAYTDWPEPISNTSASMWVDDNHSALSNNWGAAMWGPGGIYEDAQFRSTYFATNGWLWNGSVSRMEPSWEVCGGVGGSRQIGACNTSHGTIHVQGFRGTDSGWRRSIITTARGTIGPAYVVAQGIYAAYTHDDPNTEWSYWMGAPVNNQYLWFPPNTNLLRQDFEGGWWMVWNKSGCVVEAYDAYGNRQFSVSGSPRYCDGGGGLASPGYGSDGN